MKINRFNLAVSLAAVFIAALPFIIFLIRAPVLVVTDLSFAQLYGGARIQKQAAGASFSLFRPVKIVAVADDAGDDIAQIAISETSSRPYCVIIPLRFAQAARLYREKNPLVPVVILEGRFSEGSNPAEFAIGNNTDDYFLYKTDINADFYRAGMAAALLDGDKNGKIAVFLDAGIQTQAREAFFRALNDLDKPMQSTFFTSYSQNYDISELSCLVLAGVGAEHLEKEAGVPVVFFSWIDPSFLPNDVVLLYNDSPWVQIKEAVRMVSAKMTKNQIPSKGEVLPSKNIDKRILRKLKKLR